MKQIQLTRIVEGLHPTTQNKNATQDLVAKRLSEGWELKHVVTTTESKYDQTGNASSSTALIHYILTKVIE